MTRLQHHQQKQYVTHVILLFVAFILVLYFIFAYGIRFVLNASVYIANLNAPKNQAITQLTKTQDQYGTISIDSIPTATNSAQFTISGSVVNFNILQFFINGARVKEINLNNNNTFSEQIGDLQEGQNEVFVNAIISDSNVVKKSDVYTIIYKGTRPNLSIISPDDKSKTNNQAVAIKGTTDKETFIKVNDLPVVVDAQGNFSTDVKLNDGDNQITVVAKDIAGNTSTKSITVTYRKDN